MFSDVLHFTGVLGSFWPGHISLSSGDRTLSVALPEGINLDPLCRGGIYHATYRRDMKTGIYSLICLSDTHNRPVL